MSQDTDLKSTTSDQYKSRLAEYEKMHNISRPVSPINLIVSSRASQPETDPGLSSPNLHILQTSFDDSYSQVSSALSIRGTNKSLRTDNPFQQRKGKPLTCNALVAVPSTIRLKNRSNTLAEDHNLLVVSRMNTSRLQTSGTLPTLDLPINTQPLGQLSVSKTLTKPALGFVEPKGEIKRTQAHLFHERKKMHRYNYGISPLERIARIEHDLLDVMTTRKKKPSSSSPNLHMPSEVSSSKIHLDPGLPNVRQPLSPHSTTSSNHITIEVSLSSTSPPQPNSASHHPDLMSPNPKSNFLLPMNSALSVFSDVQSIGGNSSNSGSASHVNIHHTSKYVNNPDTYSQQKFHQMLTHELTRPAMKENEKNRTKPLPSKSNSSPSTFSEAMKSPLRSQRDPASFLVKDHRPDSPNYKLYRLEGEANNSSEKETNVDGSNVSFDFLKQKILSTKDKIYDCGPEYYQKLYAEGDQKKPLELSPDDPIHAITKLNKTFSRENEGENLSNTTMPSR